MVNGVTINTQAVAQTGYSQTVSSEKTAGKSKAKYFEEEAVVYEKSTPSDADRAETIKKLKADADAQTESLRQLVEKMLLKQGAAASNNLSTWKKLANEGLITDTEASKKAADDVSENGYWGADQTSDRILSFASALAGSDKDKMREMVEAFKKGYAQAQKQWGGELPDLCKSTYDSVMEKFDKWFEEN